MIQLQLTLEPYFFGGLAFLGILIILPLILLEKKSRKPFSEHYYKKTEQLDALYHKSIAENSIDIEENTEEKFIRPDIPLPPPPPNKHERYAFFDTYDNDPYGSTAYPRRLNSSSHAAPHSPHGTYPFHDKPSRKASYPTVPVSTTRPDSLLPALATKSPAEIRALGDALRYAMEQEAKGITALALAKRNALPESVTKDSQDKDAPLFPEDTSASEARDAAAVSHQQLMERLRRGY